ncbi:autotransporter domain-containing protein [Mesorhizobium sp. ANAO-SY3R2]|uniref:autotransporter outer membrane beta-barrel domain-containing protein n=1 Tax=Mesorhizobium sp. ANAO-SY3R2 TaxID=3166644 RepID=UPI00366B33A9
MGNSSHSDAPEERVALVRSLRALRSTTAWVGVAFSVVALPPLALGTLLLGGAPSAIAAGGGGSAGGFAGGDDSDTGTGANGTKGDPAGWAGGGGGAGADGGSGGAGGAGAAGGAGGDDPGGSGLSGADDVGSGGGGGGGGGAHGFVDATLPTSDTTGGNGGNGGSSPSYDGGGGGAGGYGAVVTGTGNLGQLDQTLNGGNGGTGGNAGPQVGAYAGNGGSGGVGLRLSAPGAKSITIGADMRGGAGGNAGLATTSSDRKSKGGAGGASVSASNATIEVLSGVTVSGGNGGDRDPNDLTGNPNYGLGGAGISGSDLAIIISGLVSGGMSGNGVVRADAITFTGGANTLTFGTSTSGLTGNIGVNGGGTLTFDQSGVDTVVDSAITGTGSVAKTGTGTITLSGANSYAGGTTVSEGTLLSNNTSGSGTGTGIVSVFDGATLGGSGTVGETVIQSGGILAPGNSIGTLNTGALTYKANAIHDVELVQGGNTAGTHNDLTLASGLVTIDSGAVLHVRPENGTDTGQTYTPGLTYTIITSTVGVTGQFGSLVDNYLFLDFTDSYDAKNVYLTSQLADVSFCLAGSTANQCAASKAVQSSAPSALFSAIVNLTDEDVARAAFDQLSGEMHASAKGMLLDDSRFVRDAVNDRLRSAFGAPSAAALPILAYGEGGAELVAADTERFAVWGNAFGSWGNNDGDGNAAAFDRSIGGLLMGGDALVGDAWRVGLMTGFSRSSFDVDDRNSSGDATSYYLGVYGGGQWGALSLRTGAAYSWNSLDTRRAVTFPGLSEPLSADYDAGTAQIFGEAGYRIDTAAASFEPFANLAYVNVRTDAFTEEGGVAALSQASSNTDATFTTLGVRASGEFVLGTVSATARGMIGWRHAFGDVTPLSTLAFAGSDAFAVAGAPIARDAAVIEAGLDFHIAPKATLGVSYTGQFGSGVSDNGAKLDLSIRF